MNRQLNEAFADIFRRMENDNMRSEAEAAKANPQAHKLSRVMSNGRLNFVYYDAGRDGRGSKVWFCRTTNRNVAGFFLFWRQVETAKRIKRDQWGARRSKKSADAVCSRRRDAFRAKRGR